MENKIKKNNVALFFRHTVPFTVGHYVHQCLKQTSDNVEVFLPAQAKYLPAGSHDLYVCIDDGTHYIFPQSLKPSAVWLIDTHTGYLARLIMARQFDYVFASCKNGTQKLLRDGISNPYWLPLACDPVFHGKTEHPKKFDVAFIGSSGWGRRKRLVQKICKRFSNSYIGSANYEDIGTIYSQAKIVFNCGIIHDLNMRLFEGLCSGSCVVTNSDTFGLSDFFRNKEHLVTYDTDAGVISLIAYYLLHDDEREKIALAGRKEVLASHTYHHRVQEMLKIICNSQQAPHKAKHRHLLLCWVDRLKLWLIEFAYKIRYRLIRKIR